MSLMKKWISVQSKRLQGEIKYLEKLASVFTLVNELPAGKGRPRFTRAGRCYTPAATRKAEDRVRSSSLNRTAKQNGQLGVLVVAVFPIPVSWSKKKRQRALDGLLRPAVKPDFDNIAKLYCDALNGVLWDDDKQIVDGRTIKYYGQEPGVLVACWSIPTDGGSATKRRAPEGHSKRDWSLD